VTISALAHCTSFTFNFEGFFYFLKGFMIGYACKFSKVIYDIRRPVEFLSSDSLITFAERINNVCGLAISHGLA
jgi:hypothetical protein